MGISAEIRTISSPPHATTGSPKRPAAKRLETHGMPRPGRPAGSTPSAAAAPHPSDSTGVSAQESRIPYSPFFKPQPQLTEETGFGKPSMTPRQPRALASGSSMPPTRSRRPEAVPISCRVRPPTAPAAPSAIRLLSAVRNGVLQGLPSSGSSCHRLTKCSGRR